VGIGPSQNLLALFNGASSTRAPPRVLVPVPALPADLRGRPEAQLLAGALTQATTTQGGKPPALIQVPASPLSRETLQALQASTQQVAIREETIEQRAASRPARELESALASVARPTTVSTTTTTRTPDTTITRTISETVTGPAQESAGVQELRQVLDRADARAEAADEPGFETRSGRALSSLTRSVERRGDRLLDELDRAVDRGGDRVDARAERALERRGGDLARAVDRLVDFGGERGQQALGNLLENNGARVVQTLGRVLEATGDRVNAALEDVLVRAGSEAIDALRQTVDAVRGTETRTVTRQETEIVPGRVETVTSTTEIAGEGTQVDAQPSIAEARAIVRRQVEAYQTTSNLLAPLIELSTPPRAVPNPAANISFRNEARGRDETRNVGPEGVDRRRPFGRSEPTEDTKSEIALRPPIGATIDVEPIRVVAPGEITPPVIGARTDPRVNIAA